MRFAGGSGPGATQLALEWHGNRGGKTRPWRDANGVTQVPANYAAFTYLLTEELDEQA